MTMFNSVPEHPPVQLQTLVHRVESGEPSANQQLFTALYDRLHRIARRESARLGAKASLGTTTLLHETYLSIRHKEATAFNDERHFLSYAARAMRHLVIDHVRANYAAKRGGGLDITSLDTASADQYSEPTALTTLSDALDELALSEPALAHVIDLKFFSGFNFNEIAAMTGVSERTVQRQWDKARTLLRHALHTS